MTIDWNKPLMLRDGTPLKVVPTSYIPTIFEQGRDVVMLALVNPDPRRKDPDMFEWTGTQNYSRWFYQDTGQHVHRSNIRVFNTIDWDQPIELDDGTPLLRGKGGDEYNVTIWLPFGTNPHPAFPIGKIHGHAQRSTGLVGSNHKYHVRNRSTQMKTIDISKPLVLNNDTRKVTFITETSEGHILVSIEDAVSGWHIFDKSGKWVRSATGLGGALRLRNKPERVTRKYSVQVTTKGEVQFVETSWGANLHVVIEDGEVVGVGKP